jgi:hypothetical protein
MTLSGHAAGQFSNVAYYQEPWRDAATEVDAVPEQVDLRVHDRVALDEIELYTEVLSAVAAAERRLTAAELDEVLGLRSAAKPGGSGRGSDRFDNGGIDR